MRTIPLLTTLTLTGFMLFVAHPGAAQSGRVAKKAAKEATKDAAGDATKDAAKGAATAVSPLAIFNGKLRTACRLGIYSLVAACCTMVGFFVTCII